MRSAALLSGLLILRATAQPTFPAGVGEKIAKIREKGVVAGGDDADKVKELTDGAAATLEESLLEAAGSKDLQQASRAPWRQRARATQRSAARGRVARQFARRESPRPPFARRETEVQAAYVKAHLRVVKYVYAGGCPRDMTGCPSGWIATGTVNCWTCR